MACASRRQPPLASPDGLRRSGRRLSPADPACDRFVSERFRACARCTAGRQTSTCRPPTGRDALTREGRADGRRSHHRLVQSEVAGGTEELGVAVVEDATVSGGEPVTQTVRRGRDAHDRLVELETPSGTLERGVAVVEDATVGTDEPVALAVRGGGNA